MNNFKLSSKEQNLVHVGGDYSAEYHQLNLVQKLRKVHTIPNPAEIPLENVAKVPHPISKEKYSDLISLCERNIIPKAHHQYFKSLPSDA